MSECRHVGDQRDPGADPEMVVEHARIFIARICIDRRDWDDLISVTTQHIADPERGGMEILVSEGRAAFEGSFVGWRG